MAHKGYSGEYTAKQELELTFNKGNVLKTAIAQMGCDFMVFDRGRLVLLVEVKQTIQKRHYSNKKEINQLARIKHFAENHNVQAELWIYYRKGKGNKMIKDIKIIYEKKLTELNKFIIEKNI